MPLDFQPFSFVTVNYPTNAITAQDPKHEKKKTILDIKGKDYQDDVRYTLTNTTYFSKKVNACLLITFIKNHL